MNVYEDTGSFIWKWKLREVMHRGSMFVGRVSLVPYKGRARRV